MLQYAKVTIGNDKKKQQNSIVISKLQIPEIILVLFRY